MANTEIKNTIHNAKPFQYLNSYELDQLIAYCKVVSFAPGDTLFQQGKKSEGLYILLEGSATVSVKVLGRESLQIAKLNKDDFIGEVSLIEKGQCTVSVIATTALKCLLITTVYYDMLSAFFPETKYKIAKGILEGVYTRLESLYLKIADIIVKSTMKEHSLLGEAIKSLTTPDPTTIEASHIDLKHLKETTFFKPLTQEEFTILLQHAELIKAPNNCYLVKEGDQKAPLYIIIRGAVQSSIAQHNHIAKLAVIGPMNLFSSIHNFFGAPAMINYITCERAILLKITPENFALLQKNHMTVWYKLFDELSKAFVELERSADKLLIRFNSELYNG